jgi:hypothetical protein
VTTRIFFRYEAEVEGATVELQELRGTTWSNVAEAPGSNSGEDNLYVKVKRPGRHTFRPVVTAGSNRRGTALKNFKVERYVRECRGETISQAEPSHRSAPRVRERGDRRDRDRRPGGRLDGHPRPELRPRVPFDRP